MSKIGNSLVRARRARFPRRLIQLQLGLALYGLSLAVFVRASLGLDPWDVFHQGISEHTGLGLGWIVNITGAVVLLLWIPLRQRPGLGTISNVLVVGTVAEVGLALIETPHALWIRILMLTTAIVLNGVATGAYIGARLGPGPRDGLMTGLKARYPRLSIRLLRTGIEVAVLAIGFLLGGSVGVGTVAYALAIGPLTQLFLPLLTVPEPAKAEPAAEPSAA
jgi:uncharacterized membrane protein YczE